jgi:hypothetical protein
VHGFPGEEHSHHAPIGSIVIVQAGSAQTPPRRDPYSLHAKPENLTTLPAAGLAQGSGGNLEGINRKFRHDGLGTEWRDLDKQPFPAKQAFCERHCVIPLPELSVAASNPPSSIRMVASARLCSIKRPKLKITAVLLPSHRTTRTGRTGPSSPGIFSTARTTI